MEIISLVGIIVTIVLFMFACFQGIPVTVSSIVLTFVIWLFSIGCPDALSFDETVAVFSTGTVSIVQKFLALFMFSALFGSIINATGVASALGRGYESLIMKAPKKMQKFLAVALVPVLNAVFIYSGISVYVVVFAVVAVAKDVFKRMDIPWYLYSLSAIGSGTFAASTLPGSTAVTNLVPMAYTNTPATAAPVLSIILSIEFLVLGCCYMQFAIKRSERKGHGFLPTGEAINQMNFYDEKGKAPVNLALAIPLLFLPVILMNIVGFSVVKSLVVTDVSLLIIYHKRFNLKQVKDTVVSGLTAGIGPTMSLGLMTGFANVLMGAPGFRPIFDFFINMPVPEYIRIVLLVGVTSFLLGNYNAALPTCFEMVGPDMLLNCGVNMEVLHRLSAAASALSFSPHNSGLCNSLTVAKLQHKETYINYFTIGPVFGTVVLITAVILINFGIVF